MNNLILAGLPILGMLACLFIGFHYIAFSKSRSAEQIGYFFFAGGVAWVIATGAILWPQVANPEHVSSLPWHYASDEPIHRAKVVSSAA